MILRGRRDVLFLRVAEAPNLVELQALAGQATQSFVLVRGAGRTDVDEQLGHGVDAHVRHAGRGAHAVALGQHTNDGGTRLQA